MIFKNENIWVGCVSGVTQDKLLPTLDASMNVFESSKSFEVKKSIFSKSLAINNGAPVSKTDSYLTVSEEASQRINGSEPVKVNEGHCLENQK